VYIRRIRYTPLSAQAVTDAYRCNSMFACYGAMPAAPMGTATTYVSLASTSAPGAGRRRLLQGVASGGSVLEAAVASVVPGLPASNVTASPSAFGLSFRLTLRNLDPIGSPLDALAIFQADGLQEPLVAGLADDVIPAPSDVLVQSVSEDASGTLLYVQVLVTGYASASDMASDYAVFAARGAAELDGAAAALNNALGLASNVYITTADTAPGTTDETYTPPVVNNAATSAALLADATLCPSYPAAWDATCVDSNGALPAVWCADCLLMGLDQLQMVTTYAVVVPMAASAVDEVEASLNSALTSGALAGAMSGASSRRRLLQSGDATNITSTNNLLMQRLLTSAAADAAGTSACAAVATREQQWQAVAIAFVVAFGVLCVVLLAFRAGRRSERRYMMELTYTDAKGITSDTRA
jgi:hypothetical protein